MAIKVLDRTGGNGCNCRTLFLCDYEEDIKNLPTEKTTGECGDTCSAGSKAIVLENGGSTWLLGNTGTWNVWNQGNSTFPDVVGGGTADDIAGSDIV